MFSSKLGFVLAAAGSAVGLGNLWRFPYLAAEYGGGSFLLVYLILVVTFGFSLMAAEIAIGRKTGKSVISAFGEMSKKHGFIGVIAAIIPLIIVSYYCVIGGWVLKYLFGYIAGDASFIATDAYFGEFISNGYNPIIWQLIFVIITAVILFGGIKKGIERASKVLMPVLLVLLVGLTIYTLTLPNAIAGVQFFLLPNFADFGINTVLGALGQMFFSMSLAMGIMITYGSYLDKQTDIERSVKKIELFDTGVAILAGLMIIPAFASFNGGSVEGISSGPGLMFTTMPKIFANVGDFGVFLALAFFVLVLFAALTSSISLLEAVVSSIRDKFKLSRKKSVVIATLITFALGIPSAISFGVLGNVTIIGMSFFDFMDFISNYILMPVIALATCLFITRVVGFKAIADEIKLSSKFKREKVMLVMLKYIAPIFLVLILVSYTLNQFGIISI